MMAKQKKRKTSLGYHNLIKTMYLHIAWNRPEILGRSKTDMCRQVSQYVEKVPNTAVGLLYYIWFIHYNEHFISNVLS